MDLTYQEYQQEETLKLAVEDDVLLKASQQYEAMDSGTDEVVDDDLLVKASQQFEAMEKTGAVDVKASQLEETLELAFDNDLFLKASQQFEAMEKADVLDVKASHEDESVELAFDDDLLLKATQQYKADITEGVDDDLVLKASQQYKGNTRRFPDPVTSDVLDGIRKSAIPEKTKESMCWSLNVWKEWSKERNAIPFTEELEKDHPLLEQFTDLAVESKQFWLPKFIIEVKKSNGEW